MTPDYLPTVLITYVGLSNERARLLTACNATSYLVFSGLAVPLVESWGRRSLMMISTAGQGFSFLVITILLSISERGGDSGRKAAQGSIAFFFLYYAAFGFGMLGVPWLYPTEINSLPMRTKGAAVATMTNWLTNFVIVEITPIGIQNLGWKFWIVWTIFNAVFLPVIYFFYPETGECTRLPHEAALFSPTFLSKLILFANPLSAAHRSLEDIDEYYRGNPSLIVAGDKDATSSRRPRRFIEREVQELREEEHKAGVGKPIEERRV